MACWGGVYAWSELLQLHNPFANLEQIHMTNMQCVQARMPTVASRMVMAGPRCTSAAGKQCIAAVGCHAPDLHRLPQQPIKTVWGTACPPNMTHTSIYLAPPIPPCCPPHMHCPPCSTGCLAGARALLAAGAPIEARDQYEQVGCCSWPALLRLGSSLTCCPASLH